MPAEDDPWVLTATGDPDEVYLELSFEATTEQWIESLCGARRFLGNCPIEVQLAQVFPDAHIELFIVSCRMDYLLFTDSLVIH